MDNQSWVWDKRLDRGFSDAHQAMNFYKERMEELERLLHPALQEQALLRDLFAKAADGDEAAQDVLKGAFVDLQNCVDVCGNRQYLHRPTLTIGEAPHVMTVIAMARMIGMAPFRVTQDKEGFWGMFGHEPPPGTQLHNGYTIPFVPEHPGGASYTPEQVREIAAEAAEMERMRCMHWCKDDKEGLTSSNISSGRPIPKG